MDSLQTPQQCHSGLLHPLPPASPNESRCPSESWPDAPWLTRHCWGRSPFHRHVRSHSSMAQGEDLWLPWVRLHFCCALLYSDSYIKELFVTEHMKCLRGSKSQLTGSVVRLKILPRPLVPLTGSYSHMGVRQDGETPTLKKKKIQKKNMPHIFNSQTGPNSWSSPKCECRESSAAGRTTFRKPERCQEKVQRGRRGPLRSCTKAHGRSSPYTC